MSAENMYALLLSVYCVQSAKDGATSSKGALSQLSKGSRKSKTKSAVSHGMVALKNCTSHAAVVCVLYESKVLRL